MQPKAIVRVGCLGLLVALMGNRLAEAKSPWQWVSFRRGAADKESGYRLSEKDGPWLVFAASFAGEGAFGEAKSLVEELRSEYRLPAFIHSQQFDFTDTMQGLGINEDRTPKRMRYDKAGVFEEYAVLVGNFQSPDDPELQKAMQKIKYARPQCLTRNPENTTRRFAGLRELHRRINGDADKKRKGPMGRAFATPNPLLPKEYFAPKGVDSFVYEINHGLDYSLLKCPAPYSVRIATFRGTVIIDPRKVEEIENGGTMKSQLEEAADKAHRLTEALRKKGVEAYEFHDRYESCVTVGGFEWVTRDRVDGSKEFNPAVTAMMQRFGPNRPSLVGKSGEALLGIQPQVIDGIALDPQPFPVEVPQRSIAADYDQNAMR